MNKQCTFIVLASGYDANDDRSFVEAAEKIDADLAARWAHDFRANMNTHRPHNAPHFTRYNVDCDEDTESSWLAVVCESPHELAVALTAAEAAHIRNIRIDATNDGCTSAVTCEVSLLLTHLGPHAHISTPANTSPLAGLREAAKLINTRISEMGGTP